MGRRDTAVTLADGGRLVISRMPPDHGEREVPGVADIDDGGREQRAVTEATQDTVGQVVLYIVRHIGAHDLGCDIGRDSCTDQRGGANQRGEEFNLMRWK
jgi:hypothetical protein